MFDGYADKKDQIQIYLVEIKTGNSKLSEIQKKIKASVLNGNIRWAEINPAEDKDAQFITRKLKNKMESQVLLDLNQDKDLDKLYDTVEAKPQESRDQLIDRIADAMDATSDLIDDKGYSIESAIAKSISDFKLIFRTEGDKILFTESLLYFIKSSENK